jgi:predicted DNA binding protein
MKKTLFSLLLATAIFFSGGTLAFAAEESDSDAYGSISANLNRPIDGVPFVAYFDADTGVMTVLDMDGATVAVRELGTEEGFWEFVAAYRDMPNQLEALRDRVNRDVSYIEVESGVLVQFDGEGNRTETALTDVQRNARQAARVQYQWDRFSRPEMQASLTAGMSVLFGIL